MHFIQTKGSGQDKRKEKPEIKRRLGQILWEGLGFFYPLRCPVCDEVLEPGEMICAACRGRIWTVTEPVCKRCGKPLEDERGEYCGDCRKRTHTYRQGKAVFVYRGGIRMSMYRFKYSGRREYAAFYAKKAAELHGKWVKRNGIEVIVPIPMYEGKSGGADTIRPRCLRGRLEENLIYRWMRGW